MRQPCSMRSTEAQLLALLDYLNRDAQVLAEHKQPTTATGPHHDNSLLVLTGAELHARLDAFLGFTHTSRWHLSPCRLESLGGADSADTQPQALPLYAICWQHLADIHLLEKLSSALEVLRAPCGALGEAEPDRSVPEAIQIGPLQEAVLQACALVISGICAECAPRHVCRPILEQLLVPSQSGFILLEADCLSALVSCGTANPRLLAADNPQQQPPQQHQPRSTSSSVAGAYAVQPARASRVKDSHDPAFVPYANAAAHSVSLANLEQPVHHQHHQHPTHRQQQKQQQQQEQQHQRPGVMQQQETLDYERGGSTQQQPTAHSPHGVTAGRTSGWLDTGVGRAGVVTLQLHRGPKGNVTAGAWRVEPTEGEQGPAWQQQLCTHPQRTYINSAHLHQGDARFPRQQQAAELSPVSSISRRAALFTLGILRDLNGIVGLEAGGQSDQPSKQQLQASEQATRAALGKLTGRTLVNGTRGGVGHSFERGPGLYGHSESRGSREECAGSTAAFTVSPSVQGRGPTLGNASTALDELGASLLDVRAVLAGLLSEMRLLGQLVDLHRNAELAGCTSEENMPYLEVITAIVASFNSPDIAAARGSKHRPAASSYKDPRFFSAVLEPAVAELTLQELCQVTSTVSQAMSSHEDQPVRKLPSHLQAQLHLLHKLVASIIILSAAPLPPSTPTHVARATTFSPSTNSRVSPHPHTPAATPLSPSFMGSTPWRFSPSLSPSPGPALTPTPYSLLRAQQGQHTPQGYGCTASSPSHHTHPAQPSLSHHHHRSLHPAAHPTTHPSSTMLTTSPARPAHTTSSSSTAAPLDQHQQLSPNKSPFSSHMSGRLSQLRGAAHPDAQLREHTSLQQEGSWEGPRVEDKELVCLQDVVAALVKAGRIFAGFAAHDIQFFNATCSTFMHTLKAVTKRLAAEGLQDHVEYITIGVAQVLACMTRAMIAGTQEARRAEAQDKVRQREELKRWEQQRAKESWKAGGALLGLIPPAVKQGEALWTYSGKPHGWGAGANRGWGDTPTPREPLTNHAWGLTNSNSSVAPSSSFNVRDSPQTSQRSGSGLVEEDSKSSQALLSHRSSSTFSSSLDSAAKGGSPSALISGLEPLTEAGEEGQDARSSDLEDGSGKSQTTSRGLDALWEALGHDADGNPLPKKGPQNAAWLPNCGPQPWPGPGKETIVHFEELLADVLSTLLHLTRGYLLPLKWRPRMKMTVKRLMALNLFKGTYVNPLPEDFLLGGVPPSVAGMWDSLGRAGLVVSLEALFEQELMSDVKYVDPTAGWDTSKGKSKGSAEEARSGEYLQVDRVRLLSVRLLADLLATSPVVALESQCAYLLRAVHKFLNLRVLPQQPPKLHSTAEVPPTAAPHTLPPSKATSTKSRSSAGFLFHSLGTASSRSPSRKLSGAGAVSAALRGGTEAVTMAGGGAAPGGTSGWGLTAYTTSSVVALAQELLPIAQAVVVRAATNTKPSPVLGGTWTPDELTSRAGILVLMHTWPPLMHAISTLLDVVTLPSGSSTEDEPGATKDAKDEAVAQKGGQGLDASVAAVTAAGQNAAPTQRPAADNATLQAASAAASAAAAKHCAQAGNWQQAPPRKRPSQAATGSRMATQGLRNAQLLLRARCIAPLHRLFQNWLQQLYQLLMRFGHIEALQVSLELVMLQGGFVDLVGAIVEGTHFTLAVRGTPPPPPPDQDPDHRDTSHIRDTRPSSAGGASQSSGSSLLGWNMMQQAEQQRPRPDQALALRKQRDTDRNYGISGVPLLGLEELLCLVHQLTRPYLAPHLAAGGTLARMHAAVLQIHARHTVHISMTRVLAAAGMLHHVSSSSARARRASSGRGRDGCSTPIDENDTASEAGSEASGSISPLRPRQAGGFGAGSLGRMDSSHGAHQQTGSFGRTGSGLGAHQHTGSISPGRAQARGSWGGVPNMHSPSGSRPNSASRLLHQGSNSWGSWGGPGSSSVQHAPGSPGTAQHSRPGSATMSHGMSGISGYHRQQQQQQQQQQVDFTRVMKQHPLGHATVREGRSWPSSRPSSAQQKSRPNSAQAKRAAAAQQGGTGTLQHAQECVSADGSRPSSAQRAGPSRVTSLRWGADVESEGTSDTSRLDSEWSTPFLPASINYDARARQPEGGTTPRRAARTSFDTWRASQTGGGQSRGSTAAGSAFDAHKEDFEGWQAALDGSIHLPRIHHWVLMSCSCMKRCCMASALGIARLAEERLVHKSATSALVERYTMLPPPPNAKPVTSAVAAAPSATEPAGKDVPVGSSVPGGAAAGGVTSMSTATATATEKALEGSQASLLQQHARTLLIACKSSGVMEQQLLGPLTHVPLLLTPAIQLRGMAPCLAPMFPDATAATRTAGMEIAATVVAQGEASQASAHSHPHTISGTARAANVSSPDLQPPPTTRPRSASSHAAFPALQRTMSGTEKNSSSRHQTVPSRPPSASRAVPAHSQHRPPGLSPLRIPSDPTHLSPSPSPAHGGVPAEKSPQPVLRGTHVQERHQQLGLAMQPWEPHASVLFVTEPIAKIWLMPEKVQQQVKLAQAVLDILQSASGTLLSLPTAQTSSICSFSESPLLLGCCNTGCTSHVHGRTEKEIHLRRCEACGVTAYCSEDCKLADNWLHRPFCEWRQHLSTLRD